MRLFVGVVPPPPALEAVRAVRGDDVAGLRWEPVGREHVTLRFLGEAAAPEVVAALEPLAAHPPVEARLGTATARLGREVLVVPVDGLGGLARAVDHATRHLVAEDVGGGPAGDGRARPRFTGHLTIARGARRLPPPRPLDAHVGRPVAPVAWVVDQVLVVRSVLGGRGPARHEPLAEVRLAGRPGSGAGWRG